MWVRFTHKVHAAVGEQADDELGVPLDAQQSGMHRGPVLVEEQHLPAVRSRHSAHSAHSAHGERPQAQGKEETKTRGDGKNKKNIA